MGGGQNGQAADGTATGNEDLFPRQCSGLTHRMQADGQGFAASGVFHIDIWGQFDQLFGGQIDLLSEQALLMGKAHCAAKETHVGALVAHVRAAILALVAWHGGIDRDLVINGKAGHVFANGNDRTGDFMPENHRFADFNRAKTAVMIVVQIRAADAALVDLNGYRARFRCAGLIDLIDTQVMG